MYTVIDNSDNNGNRVVVLDSSNRLAEVLVHIKDGRVGTHQNWINTAVIHNSLSYKGEDKAIADFLYGKTEVEYLETPETKKPLKIAHLLLPMLDDVFDKKYPRTIQFNNYVEMFTTVILKHCIELFANVDEELLENAMESLLGPFHGDSPTTSFKYYTPPLIENTYSHIALIYQLDGLWYTTHTSRQSLSSGLAIPPAVTGSVWAIDITSKPHGRSKGVEIIHLQKGADTVVDVITRTSTQLPQAFELFEDDEGLTVLSGPIDTDGDNTITIKETSEGNLSIATRSEQVLDTADETCIDLLIDGDVVINQRTIYEFICIACKLSNEPEGTDQYLDSLQRSVGMYQHTLDIALLVPWLTVASIDILDNPQVESYGGVQVSRYTLSEPACNIARVVVNGGHEVHFCTVKPLKLTELRERLLKDIQDNVWYSEKQLDVFEDVIADAFK